VLCRPDFPDEPVFLGDHREKVEGERRESLSEQNPFFAKPSSFRLPQQKRQSGKIFWMRESEELSPRPTQQNFARVRARVCLLRSLIVYSFFCSVVFADAATNKRFHLSLSLSSPFRKLFGRARFYLF